MRFASGKGQNLSKITQQSRGLSRSKSSGSNSMMTRHSASRRCALRKRQTRAGVGES